MTEPEVFGRSVHSIARARRHVRDALQDMPPDLVDKAEIIVSELATNSFRHAESDFIVAIERRVRDLRVTVTDHGPGEPRVRSPDSCETSGRGLQIVEALADQWGISATTNDGGKAVWFTLDVPTIRAVDPRRNNIG